MKASLLTLACCFGLNTGGHCSAASHEAPPSLDQIIEGLTRTERLLFRQPTSFRIVYVRDKTVQLGPKGDYLPYESIGAHKDNKWFIKERGLDAEAEAQLGGDARVYVSKGAEVVNWTLGNRHCNVVPFEEGWNMYSGWRYFQIMGYDVNRYVAQSGGADYEAVRKLEEYAPYLDHPFLPEHLEVNRAKYRVAPEAEDVEGFSCWLVEWPGMDRIWVDSQHGYAIRRRMYHWAPGKPLRYGIVQSDFREVRPGLWIPYTQHVDHYASVPSADEKWWGKVINKSVYRVRAMEFDNVPDEIFDISLPPGTRVLDTERNVRYVVSSEGADPFEDALNQARTRFVSRKRSWWLVVALNSAVVAVLLVLYVCRRMSSTAS